MEVVGTFYSEEEGGGQRVVILSHRKEKVHMVAL